MKVGDLKLGMIVEPAGDSEVFFLRPPPSGHTLGWITVRGARGYRGGASKTNQAMYLGDRKKVNVSREDFSFSNRFVLIDGVIAAVDPSSWIRIKRVM